MNEYFFWIFYPVLIWLIGLIILFFFLLRHYTFGDSKTKNLFKNETFAMPPGIFRGILTLSLLFLVMLLEVVSLVDTQIETYIDNLLIAFQMMLAFYFGGKVMNQVAKSDEQKTKDRAETLIGVLSPKNVAGDADAVG